MISKVWDPGLEVIVLCVSTELRERLLLISVQRPALYDPGPKMSIIRTVCLAQIPL